MKLFARCVISACSAALAACCLLAGRHAVAPVRPNAGSGMVLQCAGQALTVLRRRVMASARRAAQALLLCLAAPVAAWMVSTRPEVWVELQALPAGAETAARPLNLPREGRTARPGRNTPPGNDPVRVPAARADPDPAGQARGPDS